MGLILHQGCSEEDKKSLESLVNAVFEFFKESESTADYLSSHYPRQITFAEGITDYLRAIKAIGKNDYVGISGNEGANSRNGIIFEVRIFSPFPPEESSSREKISGIEKNNRIWFEMRQQHDSVTGAYLAEKGFIFFETDYVLQ